jgi:hypothetical protein
MQNTGKNCLISSPSIGLQNFPGYLVDLDVPFSMTQKFTWMRKADRTSINDDD